MTTDHAPHARHRAPVDERGRRLSDRVADDRGDGRYGSGDDSGYDDGGAPAPRDRGGRHGSSDGPDRLPSPDHAPGRHQR